MPQQRPAHGAVVPPDASMSEDSDRAMLDL